ncbi:uncharacterized protein CTRU02_207203 [Colletotrichum truncatum]|uniref:Uncharacterized protein n=1 Tax=Colletotrichum truncatum TaxID=5467 RepID=A0ACC3Z063_COLTU|nr:uncharacterized protein CTRU02_01166 [Colletotrichum truncatum]KAF6800761.1 hypothetical protein CTRU02_01166 [Colletotrichum truncatum]
MDDYCHENHLQPQRSVRFVKQGRDGTSGMRRRSVLGRVENQQIIDLAFPENEAPRVSSYTTNYIKSLPPVELYRPLDECASAPSSFRSLRKSRSMIAPTNLAVDAGYFFSNSPSLERRDFARKRKSMVNIRDSKPSKNNQGLRTPKSTSILNNCDRTTNTRVAVHDAVDARLKPSDPFRNQEEQLLRSRPSRLFTLNMKNKKVKPRTVPDPNTAIESNKDQERLRSHASNHFASQQQGIRQSMRKGSTNTLYVSKEGSFAKQARKVSSGLKSKLKTLFHRKKKNGTKRGGKGQVETVDDVDAEDDPYMDIADPMTDECSVSQVPSRVPSLHAASLAQKLPSRQGSIDSIGSDRKVSDSKMTDEKSRVTSWTSSGTHTLNSQSTWGGERDRQRLSVIIENGTHVANSSLRRISTDENNHYGFQSPSPPQLLTRQDSKVDSDKVFFALLGRLQEAQPKEKVQKASSDEILNTVTNDLRTISNDSRPGAVGKRSPPTIRCVMPEDDVFQDTISLGQMQHTKPIETAVSPDKGKPESPLSSSSSSSPSSSPGSVIRQQQHDPSGSTLQLHIAYPEPADSDERKTPSRKTRAAEGSSVGPKTLSTRSSAFFGSPTCHLFRTTSPYRRALQESMKESSEVITKVYSPTVSALNLDLISTKRRPSISADDPRLAYSDSIYSDQFPLSNKKPADVLETLPNLQAHRTSDDSISRNSHLAPSKRLFSGAVVECEVDGKAPSSVHCHKSAASQNEFSEALSSRRTVPTDRASSSASSVEWKMLLSANVSGVDIRPAAASARGISLDEAQHVTPSLPTVLGHTREGAQVEDDSPVPQKPNVSREFIPLRQPDHSSQALSAGRVGRGANPSTFSTPRQFRDENEIPSSDGWMHSGLYGMYDPPPIPPRSSLRTAPSMPLLQQRSTQNNIPVKSPKRAAHKMRSVDAMPDTKLGVQQKHDTRAPMKLVRRVGLRAGLKSSLSSSGLNVEAERQFGPMLASGQLESPKERWENSSGRHLLDSSDLESTYNPDTARPEDWKAQKLGSQQMVENFLSSRRRVLAGSDDSRVFL